MTVDLDLFQVTFDDKKEVEDLLVILKFFLDRYYFDTLRSNSVERLYYILFSMFGYMN